MPKFYTVINESHNIADSIKAILNEYIKYFLLRLRCGVLQGRLLFIYYHTSSILKGDIQMSALFLHLSKKNKCNVNLKIQTLVFQTIGTELQILGEP